jgi:hypothetical protein
MRITILKPYLQHVDLNIDFEVRLNIINCTIEVVECDSAFVVGVVRNRGAGASSFVMPNDHGKIARGAF